MRHVTAMAIEYAVGSDVLQMPPAFRACDWCFHDGARMGYTGIGELLSGRASLLPDCPTCAAFVDMALTIRNEKEQERVNAEIDAERA